MLAYWLLFSSAFLAATIFPFYSEVLLATLVSQGYSAALVWLVATSGNTLGAIVNWLLGRYLLCFEHRSWFPFKQAKLQRVQRGFQRYGYWSLLLSWVPVIGDPLTFLAGVMRVNFFIFLGLVAIGKGLRYLLVILLVIGH